eukprot:9099594-Ditylum_brightwellii.AAC.1
MLIVEEIRRHCNSEANVLEVDCWNNLRNVWLGEPSPVWIPYYVLLIRNLVSVPIAQKAMGTYSMNGLSTIILVFFSFMLNEHQVHIKILLLK